MRPPGCGNMPRRLRGTTARSVRPTWSAGPSSGTRRQRRRLRRHPLAGRVRRPGPHRRAQLGVDVRVCAGRCARGAQHGRPGADGRRAASASARPSSRQQHLRADAVGRPGVVPAVQRARCRQRPWPGCHRAERDGDASSSTGRRCGAAAVATATGASSWRAPIPTRPSTRGSRSSCFPMDLPGVEVRPLRADDRRGRVRRGLLHRRRAAGRAAARPVARRLGRRHGGAHQRARPHRHQHRRPRAPARVDGQARRRARRCNPSSASGWPR